MIQRWTLEETNSDFTRDSKHTICKQEFSILAFAFIAIDTLLCTYDSSATLRIFDVLTFRLLASKEKMIKKTSKMVIIELCHGKIALLG